jgi:hypothetical protein
MVTKSARRVGPARQQIERWQNVERVLHKMPEHERQKHWDMATWGEKTACGTVACAAGHCGLDPWFRRRGFKLDFKGGDYEISDVPEFFGFEGARRIFFNAKRRPVEAVLAEVREYVAELRQATTLSAKLKLPAIGAEWPEQGGIFAGVRICRNGAPPYALILGPEYDGYLNWNSAISWAAGLAVSEHKDFTLPDRDESAALFDKLRGQFKQTWYWTSEQPAGYSGYAWGQGFTNGYQYDWRKGVSYRARAVRRFKI